MTKRLYAPFIKVGRRWVRAKQPDGTPRMAFFMPKASQVYQDWLWGSTPSEERQLRPLPRKKKEN